MTATFDALSQLAASTERGGGSKDRQGALGSGGWCNQSNHGTSKRGSRELGAALPDLGQGLVIAGVTPLASSRFNWA